MFRDDHQLCTVCDCWGTIRDCKPLGGTAVLAPFQHVEGASASWVGFGREYVFAVQRTFRIPCVQVTTVQTTVTLYK